MEKIVNEKVERIVDLIEWFKEFQPKDLDQVERILLGLKYVDKEVVESELRQDIYRTIKNTKLQKHLESSYELVDAIFRIDVNKRVSNNK